MTPIAPLLLAALAAADPTGPAPEAPPDVLVLVLDDLGWEDLVDASLPSLEALSAWGRSYINLRCSPTSSPSRYQLHFGRYPHRALIGDELHPSLDGGAPTRDLSLAERLSVAGYRTAAFGGWQVNGAALTMRTRAAARVHGFEHWRAGSIAGLEASAGSHYSWQRIDDGLASTEHTYSTTAIVDALVDWWTTTEGQRFAVASFLAPHAPYEAPPAGLINTPLTAAATPRDMYLAALEAIDTELARVLGAIDPASTWVFLLGDNGVPAAIAPPTGISAGYAPSQYEGGIRTPMLAWGPGIAPGVDSNLLQIVDLPSTILELTGTAAPFGFDDSISFASTFNGGPGSRPYTFTQRFAPNSPNPGPLTLDQWSVVRADGWKLVGEGASTWLFDLTVDPGESFGVTNPVVEAELAALRLEALGTDWPY
jgi:arylsulfatase B